MKVPWKILSAILLAFVVGKWLPMDSAPLGFSLYNCFELFGKLFLSSLSLIVVPLISSSIIAGVARIGGDAEFGRLSAKTFSFYIGTSLLAILIGLFFVNLLQPGSAVTTSELAPILLEPVSLLAIAQQIIPSNIVEAFSKGQILGIIFFSMLFGFAISRIESKYAEILLSCTEGVFQAMLKITQLVMKLLPFGVFCLVVKVFATTGSSALRQLSLFTLAVLLGLATFTFVGLPLLLKIFARVSPWLHLKAMSPALLTAFSTSSSSATLPLTMECTEKRAGISLRICRLVIPLGTSINMSGSALYECVAALFVAQAYGLDLSITTQFLVVLLALFTSIGVAGIPSGSLVAIMLILQSIGLPAEGIGLFLAVDRILDMCRTTVNVFSDSCCAVVVARSEGEKTLLARPEALAKS